MKQETKTKLCPFKKITERDQDGYRGKTINNERFAPCAGNRCMAYLSSGKCARLENSK